MPDERTMLAMRLDEDVQKRFDEYMELYNKWAAKEKIRSTLNDAGLRALSSGIDTEIMALRIKLGLDVAEQKEADNG